MAAPDLTVLALKHRSEARGQAPLLTLPSKVQAHRWEGENDSTAGGPARGPGDAFGTSCAGAAVFRPRLLPTLQQPVLVPATITGPSAVIPRRIVISGGVGGASRDARADLDTYRDPARPSLPNPPMKTMYVGNMHVSSVGDVHSWLKS